MKIFIELMTTFDSFKPIYLSQLLTRLLIYWISEFALKRIGALLSLERITDEDLHYLYIYIYGAVVLLVPFLVMLECFRKKILYIRICNDNCVRSVNLVQLLNTNFSCHISRVPIAVHATITQIFTCLFTFSR